MLRFLVVAPLTVELADLPLANGAQATTALPPEGGRMDSQEHFDAGHLTHTYVRHLDEPAPYPDSFELSRSDAHVALDNVRLVVAADAVFLQASARITAEEREPDVPRLEELLSQTVRSYVTEHVGAGAGISWVNRTLIAPIERVPTGWLAPSEDVERVIVRMNGHSPVLTVGWGNNALELDAEPDGIIRTRLLEGLTDAQLLWIQLDRIASRSAAMIRAYNDPKPAPRRKRQPLAWAKIDTLSKDLASHNLYYDDLLLNLQGTRKVVALSTLKSWGYEPLLDRVSRRVNEIERVARQETESRRNKYQEVVEAVLLAIGLVSFVHLLLAMVQTAFSGGVSAVPGGRDSFSIMAFLRAMDLDLAIWLTSLATLLAFLAIVLVKRRGE